MISPSLRGRARKLARSVPLTSRADGWDPLLSGVRGCVAAIEAFARLSMIRVRELAGRSTLTAVPKAAVAPEVIAHLHVCR